jgi:predicted DsbA family dithiol-disulfide isomerase
LFSISVFRFFWDLLSMTATLKIDFVSDIACPWCAVGLAALEGALEQLQGELQADVQFQPFELNPNMPAGGQDMTEHITQKYGSTPQEQAQMRENIRARGAEVGFAFAPHGRERIDNTLDAHRLLHWAQISGTQGQQYALKKALLVAYQGRAQCVESHAVLLACVAEVGMDVARAEQILQSDTFASEVRAREQFYLQAGVHSVPAVIVNEQYLISGGQPVEVFVQALRRIAAGEA